MDSNTVESSVKTVAAIVAIGMALVKGIRFVVGVDIIMKRMDKFDDRLDEIQKSLDNERRK